jgi:beta-N-acetylhexosaminidase
LLANLQWDISAQSLARLARMHGKHHPADMTTLREDAEFMQAVHQVAQIGKTEGDLPFTA